MLCLTVELREVAPGTFRAKLENSTNSVLERGLGSRVDECPDRPLATIAHPGTKARVEASKDHDAAIVRRTAEARPYDGHASRSGARPDRHGRRFLCP